MYLVTMCLYNAITAVTILSVIIINTVFWNIENPPNRYHSLNKRSSTKTPYDYVANKNTTINLIETIECKPIQIWLVARHGTRYPNKKDISLLQYKIPTLTEKLNKNRNEVEAEIKHIIQALSVWEPKTAKNIDESYTKLLHVEGKNEMFNLANRFVDRFQMILKDQPPEMFKFRSTNEQRTEQSKLNFLKGLFHGNKYVSFDTDNKATIPSNIDEPSILPHDPTLRMYKLCKKWQVSVKENPVTYSEIKHFELSETFNTTLLHNLNERLGFKNNLLTLEDIDAMHVACIFGQAWDPYKWSPWCSLFTQDMLDILEYRRDLLYYWKDGYGSSLNGAQACILVKDAIEMFKASIKGGIFHKGTFYFTHSAAILKLLSYLGLYKEECKEMGKTRHLLHDNYLDLKDNRKWRTSTIGTFGTNIAFVLTNCSENDYKVGLLHNELLMDIPGCESKNKWCDYPKFMSLFDPKPLECNISEICRIE